VGQAATVGVTYPRIQLVPGIGTDLDAVAIGVFADHVSTLPDHDFLAATGFAGRVGEVAALPGELVRIMVGCGPREAFEAAVLRRAAATLARAASRFRAVAIMLPDGATSVDPDAAVRAVVEGFLLALYRFDRYKSKTDPAVIQRLDVVAPDMAGPAVAAARYIAAAVRLARDLGNEPGNVLTPPVFAERVAEVAEPCGLECDVWDERRIKTEGLGGLLGVSRGSTQPPRLVTITYQPDHAVSCGTPAPGHIALVGKGITFDSGGLTIKPNSQMLHMKMDMAGAAAVLGAMSALRELGCSVRVVGWLPLADNMSGGDAMRLGDVLRMRNGTTVEVRNADAEGRLVLADALALASESRPDAIVDLATLTGATALAVGRGYAGLAGNHDGWVNQVRAAADRAGELVWPLPLTHTDLGWLTSRIADLVNVPDRKDGQSVAAAQFLQQFVPAHIPWAHLDIEGPVYTEHDDGEHVVGATGFGVRTLLELLASKVDPLNQDSSPSTLAGRQTVRALTRQRPPGD
jgi:leucyl aminopeptidase